MPSPVHMTPSLAEQLFRTARSITDAKIRELRRQDPSLLDMLMVAIHSADRELRRLARRWFAEIAKQQRR